VGINFGTATPSDFKLGSAAVSAIYLGSSKVWPESGTPAATDQYFNQVALLLHGDSLVDSSRYGRSVSASGSAAVSSTQNKFGSQSLYFPSGGNGIFSIATTGGGFNIYGDYVLEWWQYLSTTTAQQYIFSSGVTNGTGTAAFSMDWNSVSGVFRPYLTSPFSTMSYGSTLSANQWQYIAVSRAGSTIRLYVAGPSSSTASLVATANDERAFLSNATTAVLGYSFPRNAISNGYIDDMRLTNGINRGYTGSTVAVPTAAFADAQASGAFAVILTGGTSFTVPSGYTSMKAWAIGQGSDYLGYPGKAGGVSYKTWSVTGGSTVSYSVGNSFATAGGNTTVTYSGTTITGNGATNSAAGGFSGGDGGATGGNEYGSGDNQNGGAIGGTAATSALSGARRPATNVSGLFAAVTLAGGTATEAGGSAAIGSGGYLNTKDGSVLGAGYGGGRVKDSIETPGAVVLSFS
jgi:hypothetical protein